VASAAIVLTATHDGGAQWGPRFLLISSPLLLVLAARAASEASGPGRARRARLGLIAFVLLAAAFTTRSSYLELRGSKRQYGDIVTATSTLTNEGDVILTNVWWFDQVNASLFGHRTFLFVPAPAEATEALHALSRAGTRHVRLVWTDEPDGESLAAATNGTCFHVSDVQPIRERALHVAAARCEAP
jgi:hypothetical protein